MELAAIHALKPGRPIERQFTSLLHFLATDFPATRLLDPANSNNIVSDLLTDVEKLRISRRAAVSLDIEQIGCVSPFSNRNRSTVPATAAASILMSTLGGRASAPPETARPSRTTAA
jgi:hypothetical protein